MTVERSICYLLGPLHAMAASARLQFAHLYIIDSLDKRVEGQVAVMQG